MKFSCAMVATREAIGRNKEILWLVSAGGGEKTCWPAGSAAAYHHHRCFTPARRQESPPGGGADWLTGHRCKPGWP
jgi:hypothetical protein